MSRFPRFVPVLVMSLLASLALCASASAQITIGQVAPAGGSESSCSGGYDEWQVETGPGASYAVPAPGGVITSWSTRAAGDTGQQLTLKIFRKSSLGYTVVGHDGPHPLAPGALDTFTTSIPVQTGDLIGMYIGTLSESSKVNCIFKTGLESDVIAYEEVNTPDGGSLIPEGEFGEYRMNIEATVLPPPAISALGTATGSIAGGTSVAIAGANLADVKAVSFGAAPATSFTVDSESQITAIAPPSATVAAVPVSVVTAAGTATSSTSFTYQGCVVPKLAGKKLKAAKKKLKAADCKLGKLTKKKGATAKSGKVGKQSPKAGKLLAPGFKVKVTLKP